MKFPIVVKNSSIDFILVGTTGQGIGVIAKNDKSNIDLIGEYIVKYQKGKTIDTNFFQNLLNVLGFNYFTNIHFVKSYEVDNILDTQDKRLTNYVFCWKGFCSPQELSTVKELLDLHIQSLISSYKNGDENELIWNLGPLVFVCSKANKTGKVWRLTLRLFIKTLTLLILSLIIFSIYFPLVFSLIR